MLTLVFLIVSVFKLCGKETLLSKIILNVLCRRLPSSSDRPSRLVRTVSQPTEPPRPVLYISYFLSPANLQQSSVAFHLEDFQQLFVCTFDHPGFTSRQQDTKHTGSEQCEFNSKLTSFLFHVFPSLITAPVVLLILFFISFM